MLNILLQIKHKVLEFESQTGIKPNVIYLNRTIKSRIDKMVKDRISLIESYPDVFRLSFRLSDAEKRFTVGACI